MKISLQFTAHKIFKKGFCEKAASNTFKTKIKYRFNIGFVSIPHFSKREKGGEDAHSVHDGMICVADGVGGWNEVGIDPSKYSRELCSNVKKEYINNGHLFSHQIKRLFVDACNKTKSVGSSTFCMCVLDMETDHMHTLNLGDSGYMLLRGKKDAAAASNPNKALNHIIKNSKGNSSDENSSFDIVYKSEEQQHSFNFPYQVGTSGDNPDESELNVHKIQENDIVILGTDGLWDNLFDNQILQVLKPFYEISPAINDLNLAADMLGQTCERYSRDERYKSPFCVKSRGLYLGGKPDDITIVIAQIIKNDQV